MDGWKLQKMVEGYAKPTGPMVPPFDKARIEETPLCFFAILEEPALWWLFVTRHLLKNQAVQGKPIQGEAQGW